MTKPGFIGTDEKITIRVLELPEQQTLCLQPSATHPRQPVRRGRRLMQADELRAVQAPLKDRYRDDPESAVVTLSASATLGEGVTCKVETGRALAVAGLHPASGGDGTELCSGDMLLEALAACAGVTMRAVATSMAIPVEGRVTAEGELDFRGTLGVDREAPVGFRAIRLRFDIETDAPGERVAKLVELTERYCVVLQTLAGSVAPTVEWVRSY
jgi:uncharacterized OsmC-like protein